jgi:hypothetical protein
MQFFVKQRIVFISCLITLFLSGCAGSQVLPVKVGKIEPNTVTVIETRFPDIEPVNGETMNFDLGKFDLSKQLLNLSIFRPDRFLDEYEMAWGGISIQKDQDNYKVTYSNGQRFRSDKLELTKVEFNIKQTQLDKQKVKLELLPEYKIMSVTDLFGSERKQLASIEKLSGDVRKIVETIKDVKIEKSYNSYDFKGEIDTEFSAESIYANFDRKLTPYSAYDKAERKTQFEISLGDSKQNIKIEVFPYKNGSKVVYSSRLIYKIDSTGYSSFTKNDIDQLHNYLNSIAND